MTRGRPVSGPASWLLRGFGVGRAVPTGRLDGGRRGQGPGSDLVEARAAIDGSIVPRREWHDGLTPAGPAHRGMKLSWALGGASALGDRSAGRTPLGVVGQPLAREEGLLAGREDELLGAIATGQSTVLVHPLQTLLRSPALTVKSRGTEGGRVGDGRAFLKGCAPGRTRARGPELIAVKIRAPSSPLTAPIRWLAYLERIAAMVTRSRRSDRPRMRRTWSASS